MAACSRFTKSSNGLLNCSLADQLFYYATTSFSYQDVGIELSQRNWVVFQAKACYNIFVSLSNTHYKFSGTGFYEFTFDWLLSSGAYVLTSA
jgi:hypothetical protein